ncbi:MAG: 23S rRNA (adenine(2503)-C(2))-methyltransferase RlmN [Candidatus Pacebacteria bacterium]|nr:23S rRNA (adenine(2503)-C(2))-methyltransferase RlmN [Candidatus Paceibacterota bacterium]
MDLARLQKFFNKEPEYRLKQARKAIFQDLIQDWREASALPLGLREKLSKEFPIETPGKTIVSKNKDAIKALFVLKDGLKIESVLMRGKGARNTVCVSSQVGCVLDCSFCATGKTGFKRNLDIYEITDQVLFFARYLKKFKEKITSVVFMGMGEPFLNYKNVIGAIKILNGKEEFNLGARHFSISTAGIVEGIINLAKEKLQINLAISLHAPDDDLRLKLMPINEKYPIKKILAAVDDYIKNTGRRVMFEYVMISGVNDSEKHAEKLAELMRGRLCFVNLISYNPTGFFKPSAPLKIKKFREILEKRGIGVTQRYRFGEDISAACGQLAGGSLSGDFLVE